MKTVTINYLAHLERRLGFSKHIFKYISKIKRSNKNKISFVIHCSTNKRYWKTFSSMLIEIGIDSTVLEYGNKFNYMSKIEMASISPLEYSISLDEDVILSTEAWNGLIESTNFLDSSNILLISPLISIEVGSIDLFIETLCGRNLELEQLYLEVDFTDVGNKWGVDFTRLNKHTIESSCWNYEEFYKEVEGIPHYYKGIHPIRVSEQAQSKVVDLILDNYEQFTKSELNKSIHILNRPYFTNHVYLIKTKVWRDILNDISLFKDKFDEVPLNLYRRKHNLNIAILSNKFGLHASYNTVGSEAQINIEKKLLKGLNEKTN